MDATVVLATLLASGMLVPVAGPSADPSPTASPNDSLQEIGRVRVTSPLCRSLVEKAVRAISLEADDDRRLLGLEGTLRTVDLDTNVFTNARGKHEITQEFVALRSGALIGRGLMKAFRAEAKTAPDEEQRTSLVAFANALDGALHRQETLADDVGRLVAYLDTHAPLDGDARDALVFKTILSMGDARYPITAFDPRNAGPLAGIPDSLTTTAKDAADELVTRAAPIADDENAAATRIDPAFGRC